MKRWFWFSVVVMSLVCAWPTRAVAQQRVVYHRPVRFVFIDDDSNHSTRFEILWPGYEYLSEPIVRTGPQLEVLLQVSAYFPAMNNVFFQGTLRARSSSVGAPLQTRGLLSSRFLLEVGTHVNISLGRYVVMGIVLSGYGTEFVPEAAQPALYVTGNWGPLAGVLTALKIEPMIEWNAWHFRLGALAGLRTFHATSPALRPGYCGQVGTGSNAVAVECDDVVNAWEFSLQARAQIDVVVGGPLVIGAQAAFEFLPFGGYSLGVFVGLRGDTFGRVAPVRRELEPKRVPRIHTLNTMML